MAIDVTSMLQGLCRLHDDGRQFISGYGYQPLPNSQADKELRTFARPESAITAYSQGAILVEVAADQVMAFVKTVTEPAQAIAPWTCVRSIIEACALASWLLDPHVDVKTRIRRSLAFRYEGLSQQVKFGRTLQDKMGTAKVLERIQEVERMAVKLGFAKIHNRKGKRAGIGQSMPSVTEIIDQTLGEESAYRLLSAATHAHPWALRQLSFRRVNTDTIKFDGSDGDEVAVHSLAKSLEPMSVGFLCLKAATCFASPVWRQCQLFGWDQERLASILDNAYNIMGIRDNLCFWRHRGSKASG